MNHDLHNEAYKGFNKPNNLVLFELKAMKDKTKRKAHFTSCYPGNSLRSGTLNVLEEITHSY